MKKETNEEKIVALKKAILKRKYISIFLALFTLGVNIFAWFAFSNIVDNDMKYVFMPEKVRFPYVLSILDYFKMFLENDYNKDFEKVVDEYLHYFGIYKYKYQYINRLSKGTKQKILIIKTILSNADVYLLDEPLAGLDKTSRLLFMSLIKLLQEKDKIIIIASHYYDEYPFNNKKVIDLK